MGAGSRRGKGRESATDRLETGNLVNALAVMAREPVAGRVKTRLTPELASGDAARLYLAFLQDIFQKMASLPGITPVVAYTPDTAEEYFRRLAPKNSLLLSQGAGDLGERLEHVSSGLFHRNFSRVAMIGSDSPDLPRDYLDLAFDRLLDHDLVIGPCIDGGYYLIGLSGPEPSLFHGIPWSTGGVLGMTLRNAKSRGLNVALLPRWYDIDTIDDLGRLGNFPGGEGWDYTREVVDTLTIPRT
jgi:rSAM/selenodomain-associated transferase 1